MDPLPIDPTRNYTSSQRYYQTHKAKRREYGREYYEKNKDRILSVAAEKRETRRQLRDNPPPPPPPPAPVVPEPCEVQQVSPLRHFKRRGKGIPPVRLEPSLTISFN